LAWLNFIVILYFKPHLKLASMWLPSIFFISYKLILTSMAPTATYSHQSATTDQFFNYRTRAKGTYWERNDPMLDDEMSLCVWYFLCSRKYPKQTGLPENKGATRSSPSLVDLGFWEINDSRWYPWPWRRINCSGYDPASW